jgi:hypothetical protein
VDANAPRLIRSAPAPPRVRPARVAAQRLAWRVLGVGLVSTEDDGGGPRSASPARRFARWLLRVFFAVVATALAVEALYVVAMNVFLSSSLFDKVVNATPDAVDIHYRRGWSLYPGRIHAEALSIRGTDSHVEWILRLDEVDFDCDLLALAHQRFHVTRARGSGVTFRARMKVASPGATAEHLKYLPPIDSLGPVAFLPSEPRYPGLWRDADWRLWTVGIDDAVAEHVREVWIEGARFQGDARIKGGFALKPVRAAEVTPARVEVREGRVVYQARTVAEPLVADIDFQLERFDPRVATGADILHKISASARGATELPDAGSLPLSLPASATIHGKVMVPEFVLRVRRGVVQDDARIVARAPSIVATMGAHAASSAVTLAASVAGGALRVRASLDDVNVDSIARAAGALVVADSRALDLASPLTDLHGVLDVPRVDVRDAARFFEDLPAKLRLHVLHVVQGRLEGSVHAEGWRDGERVSGTAALHGRDLDVTAAGARFRGRLDAAASLGSLWLERGRAENLRLDAALPGARLLYAGRRLDVDLTLRAHARALSMERRVVVLDEARLEGKNLAICDERARRVLSIARASIAATSPRLAFADPLARLDVVAAVGGGRVVASPALRDLLPSGDVGFVFEEGSSFDADAALGIRAQVAHGAASVFTHGFGVASRKVHVSGAARAVADVARWSLRERTVAGSLAVSVEDVTGGFGPEANTKDFVVGRLEAHASSSAFDLAHPSMRGMDYGLRVRGAELADARSLNTFLPSPAILAIESGRASVSAELEASGTDGARAGTIDVGLLGGGLRLHETRLLGDFALQVRGRAIDLDRATVDLEGSSLAMRRVRVTGATTDTSGWQGDLVLERGGLVLSPTPRLEGDLTLRARDANALLGVLFRDTFPGILASLAQMPSLTAAAHVVVEPDDFVVSDLFAAGGDLGLRGTYVLREGSRRAAFVVEKGPFSVGLRLDDAGAHLHFFGLNAWYGERSRQALAAW